MRIHFGVRLFLLFAFFLSPLIVVSAETTNDTQIAAIKAQMDTAISQVERIVNQPVTELQRVRGMDVGKSSPGWFHPGATEPDFLTVDVRKTQEFPYTNFEYVTSDLNPGVVFVSSELEFNSMTKYFYTNRSFPKKRLTEAEMLEINRLYRVIGKCEQELSDLENPVDKQSSKESEASDELQNPHSMQAAVHLWIFTHKPVAAGIIIGLIAMLILLRMLRSQKSAD